MVLTIAVGMASRLWPVGVWIWDKSVGDVAYAVLFGLVLAVVWPRLRPRAIFALTVLGCFAIELFQLTGLPRRAPRLLHLALGDTFSWHDVCCYVIGAAVIALLVAEMERRRQAA
jgi:hypothetical protein